MGIPSITAILERAKTWPEDDQATLAEFAREIELHRTGIYAMTADERDAVERGLAEADRGDFASDEDLQALRARFGSS